MPEGMRFETDSPPECLFNERAIESATSLRSVEEPSMFIKPKPLVSHPTLSERYCQKVKPAAPPAMAVQTSRLNVVLSGGTHQLPWLG